MKLLFYAMPVFNNTLRFTVLDFSNVSHSTVEPPKKANSIHLDPVTSTRDLQFIFSLRAFNCSPADFDCTLPLRVVHFFLLNN